MSWKSSLTSLVFRKTLGIQQAWSSSLDYPLGTFSGGVLTLDDRVGHDTLILKEPKGLLYQIHSGPCSRISCNPSPGTTRHWKDGYGTPPTPLPGITSDLPGMGGGGGYHVHLSNVLLYLVMGCKKYCCKVHCAFGTVDPLDLSGLMCHVLPCNPMFVRLR